MRLKFKGEYVQVRGRVNKWRNPHNGRESLQILVNLVSQVTVPSYTPPGSHLSSAPVVEDERKEP